MVFENHDTVLLQIQEMLRTERITAEAGILHELETYNELVPGPGELSATLFVEIADRDTHAARHFIFMTGDAGAVERSAQRSGAAVLPKPFTAADLDAVLKRLQSADRGADRAADPRGSKRDADFHG